MSQAGQGSGGGGTGAGYIRPKLRTVVEIGTEFGNYSVLPYAVPLEATTAIAPSIGTASFRYHYGQQVKRTDKFSFSSFEPQDGKDYYVRIKTIGSNSQILWAGYAQATRTDLWGATAGKQIFTCFELTHKLQKIEIDGAWVRQNGTTFWIENAPTFNLSFNGDPRIRGNKSDAEYEGRFLFGAEETKWSNYDIIQYLIKEVQTITGLEFQLAGLVNVLKNINDVVPIQGRNVFDIFNDLINRQRGMGWYVNALGAKPEIVVFPLLDTSLKLGTVEIPANTKTSNLTASRIDTKISILNSFGTLYDQVVVYGQRILKMATLGIFDGFEEYWTVDAEQEYKDPNALGMLDLIGDETDEYIIALADRFRGQDKYNHVYTRFRIKKDWDFLQRGGVVDGPQETVLSSCTDLGIVTADETAKMYLVDKRFETFLPIRDNYDYGPDGPRDLGKPGGEITYRAPFAFVGQPVSDIPEGADQLHFYLDAPLDDYQLAASQLVILNRDMAVQLRTGFGGFFGKDNLDPQKTNYIPFLRYDQIRFTLAFRLDRRLKVVAKRKGAGEVAERKKVLYIQDAEYWEAASNTVIDIVNGKPQIIQTNPGNFATPYILRDDSDRLYEIATYALAWYGTPRAMVDVDIAAVQKFVDLGTLLKTVSQNQFKPVQANTVVSSISYNFTQTGATRIRTNWMEFDYPEA